MKSASIKEASKALGLTESAVRYRLHKGLLAGRRLHNERGKLEWQVDLETALRAAQMSPPPSGRMVQEQEDLQVELQPVAELSVAVSAGKQLPESEVIDARPLSEFTTATMSDAFNAGRLNVQMIAESLIRPLLEKLTMQTLQLAEKERVIEEQSRQLRLIPDLEKLAEQERQSAERHQAEIDQLKNQIAELSTEKDALANMASRTESLAGELEEWRQRNEAQQREWEFQQQQVEALRAEIILVQQEKSVLQRSMTRTSDLLHEKYSSDNWFKKLLKLLLD